MDNVDRRFATQSFLSLQKAWLLRNMNPATGSGGTCFGDSGAAFPRRSHVEPHRRDHGDRGLVCKATDKTYRLDTPAARDLLDGFAAVP